MTSHRARPLTLVLLAALALAFVVLAPQAQAAVPPFDLLPVGAAPTAVPYSIGTRVFYNGIVTDLAAKLPTNGPRQFEHVVSSRGITYTSDYAYAAGCYTQVGRIAPGLPWRAIVSTLEGCDPFDASTGGLAAVPGEGKVIAYRSDGTTFAAMPRANPHYFDGLDVGAAGTRFVVAEYRLVNGGTPGTYLWLPGTTPQKLPDNYRSVGRLGVGWLGARLDKFCWQTAPADNPLALRPTKLCSMTRPLLSPDGTRAVLVQSGRVRVVNTSTNATISLATMAAITGWKPGTREAVPTAWESTDSYLIAAKYDGALALVRCSMSTGKCNRAVRSYVRTGVSSIVTERGSVDAVSLT